MAMQGPCFAFMARVHEVSNLKYAQITTETKTETEQSHSISLLSCWFKGPSPWVSMVTHSVFI